MKKAKVKHNFLNIVVILIATFIFVSSFLDLKSLFIGRDIRHISIIILTVFLVHLIKAGRLYLALYGEDIKFREYLKIYCKVIPVSVVFPYKLGEFFKMYCYGNSLNNMLKGIIIVILDRFMDTIALVTMILFVWIFNGGKITSLVYMLLIFLVCVTVVYLVFPGVYRYWKKYILRTNATEYKLYVLKVLEVLNNIYQEITSVSKGKGILLYFLSLIAWTIEIGSLVLLNGISQDGKLNQIISSYLSAAMGAGQSIQLRHFVFISVIMMMTLYVFIKIVDTVWKE